MIKNKLILFILMLLFIIPLYGCADKKELEEQAFVSVIGLDRGMGNNIRLTFQIINVNYGATAKTAGNLGGEKTETITFEAPDIVSARDLANVSVSRRIVLSHAKVLVVGEEFAKEDDFFKILESNLRDRELRRGIQLIVSKEKASEFIRGNNPKLESRINKFYEFMFQRWKETGLVPVSDLNKYLQRSEEDTSLYLAVYGTTRKFDPKLEGGHESDYFPGELAMEGGNPTEIIGAAVFKSGKMIGALSGEETRIVSLLRKDPDVRSMIYTVPDPVDDRYRVTLRIIRNKKTKVVINTSDENPKVDVNVPLVVEVLAIPSLKNYVEDLTNQKLLKTHISDYLKEKSEFLVKKTKFSFASEPFLWELQVRKNFPTYDQYKAYDWLSKYNDATININYDIEVKRFGKQLSPPKTPSEIIYEEE